MDLQRCHHSLYFHLVHHLLIILYLLNQRFAEVISVDLPDTIIVEILDADAVVKGQTASSSYKPATLENGIKIMVPPFIDSDDKIILDTRTLEYIKKVK